MQEGIIGAKNATDAKRKFTIKRWKQRIYAILKIDDCCTLASLNQWAQGSSPWRCTTKSTRQKCLVLFLLFFQKVKRLPPEGHSQSGSLFLFVAPSCCHRPSEPSSHGSSGYFWLYPKSRCTKGRSEWMNASSESSVWCSGFQTQRWWKNFQKSCRFCRKNFL